MEAHSSDPPTMTQIHRFALALTLGFTPAAIGETFDLGIEEESILAEIQASRLELNQAQLEGEDLQSELIENEADLENRIQQLKALQSRLAKATQDVRKRNEKTKALIMKVQIEIARIDGQEKKTERQIKALAESRKRALMELKAKSDELNFKKEQRDLKRAPASAPHPVGKPSKKN